jgi:hypothetical protein
MQTSPSPSRLRRSRCIPAVTVLAFACCLLQTATASAATVTFKPYFTPNELNVGTTWTSEMTFTGTEYDGRVEPLTKLMVHLPAGVGGSQVGFPVCEQSTLETDGPAGCPSGSMAGPEGSIGLEGNIGPSVIKETGILYLFFAPDERLLVFLRAESPLNVEIVTQGSYVSDISPYGRVLTVELPLIEPVPGAPDLSTTALDLHFGTSRMERGDTINSVTVPSTCPPAGFPWAADPTFYQESEPPLNVTYLGACPGPQTLGETTTTLNASNTVSVVGEAVTYTATVTSTEGGPAPSGHVAFWDDGVVLPECDAQPLTQGSSTSTATCQVTYLATGSHQITASYEGDLDYNGSGSTTVTVNVQAATVTPPPAGGGGSSNVGGSSSSLTPVTTSGGPRFAGPPPHPPKPLTKAQLLAKALKLCERKKPHSKRKTCEAQARKRYKPKPRQVTKR